MSAPRALPDGPLVAFYGDDFTGSSAAMEALAFAGLDDGAVPGAADARAARRLRRLPRHRHRRRRALARSRLGWTGICRRSSGSCSRSERRSSITRSARPSTRRRMIGCIGRADRHRGASCSTGLDAARRRRAGDGPFPVFRPSLRAGAGARLPARPASDHGAASGHAHGRGRSRPPSGASDRQSRSASSISSP